MEPAALVNLFSANLPPGVSEASPAALKSASLNACEKAYEESVEISSSDHQEWYRVWIDREKGVMLRMEAYGQDGKLFLTARFEDYQPANGYNWPRRIECSFIPQMIQLKVKYKQFSLNTGTVESIFRLQYPPGTMIDNIDNS